MRVVSCFVLVFYLCLIIPFTALAAPKQTQNLAGTKVPCLEFISGRWKKVSKSRCVQLTESQYRVWVDRLVQLQEKNKILDNYKQTEAQYKALDKQWRLSLRTWVLQQESYKTLIQLHQKEAQIWKDSFLKLQKIKSPTESWTKSPVLWFTLGALTAAGLTIGVTFAIGAATK